MTQADPSDDAQAAEDSALTRLEHKLCLLESAVHELLAEEAPPMRPAGRSRRRHPVKLYVITGGLAALLWTVSYLPPQNPVRMVVDRTVTAVVKQLPDFQPQVSLLNPYVGHPAAGVSQPGSSPLTLIHVSPSPTPQPSATPATAAVAIPLASPDSASATSPSGFGPIALPIVTSAPTAPLTSAQPAASPVPSPTPTALPSSPAPSPTGGAGPSVAGDQQQQGDKGKKKPKPSPTP